MPARISYICWARWFSIDNRSHIKDQHHHLLWQSVCSQLLMQKSEATPTLAVLIHGSAFSAFASLTPPCARVSTPEAMVVPPRFFSYQNLHCHCLARLCKRTDSRSRTGDSCRDWKRRRGEEGGGEKHCLVIDWESELEETRQQRLN